MRLAPTARMIPVLMVVCFLILPAPAQYSGGDGTAADPYQIGTAGDLMLLGETPADYDKHFILTADIDLHPNLPGGKVFSTAVIASDTDLVKDGHQGGGFRGVFDGKGHTISSLTIDGADYLGLFGRTSHSATISNLGIKGAEIKGTNQIAALVGDNSGWITECHTTASGSDGSAASGNWRVGGLVGENSGTLSQCYNASAVSGISWVGGLVGENSGTLSQCYNTGVISGGYTVGGLFGRSWDFSGNTRVTACYNTGAVSGDEGPVGGLVGVLVDRDFMTDCHNSGVVSGSYAVGGLVGNNDGATMIRCYNTGAVTGRDRVGGLVGVMGGIFGNSTARRCFSIADVRGEAGVGGLVGDSIGVIEDCYAIARVTGEQDVGGLLGFNGSSGVVSKCFSASHVSGTQNAKGLVGSNEEGNITASFWDIESSGLPGRPTEGAKTTTQMQQASTFLEAGWDFVDETENGVLNIWWIEESRDYPRFWWHSGRTPYSGGGTGEPNDPYQIATAEDLTLLGETPGDYHKHFILTADIDLDPNLPGGKVFDTAVIAPDWTLTSMSGFQGRPFTGAFDGNGHKILRMTIDDASCLGYLGLFGQLGPGAEVSNLGLEAVAINGAGDYIGGFAGESDGRIASSYCTGTISGTGSYVGGLVGSNRGYITASYSTCTISGRWHVGGLASENDGRIATSYSTGTISGWTHVGGLIGSDGGTISSFWDIETSGQTTSDDGTGLTTAEMHTASTFLDAGWDFVGETENGIQDIWKIVEGQTYPLLSWQKYDGGVGEPNDPYLIYTAEQMNQIGLNEEDWDKHFRLMNNIDLSSFTGTSFNIIGRFAHHEPNKAPFTGVFDGNGHTISNFTIDSNSLNHVGIFGYVDGTAKIRDVGLIAPTVAAEMGTDIGSLVGYLQNGSITNCYVEGGDVSGYQDVGGLVGGVLWGSIINCCSSANVTGESVAVGGLVGWSHGGHIESSFAGSCVTGESTVGGIVGRNSVFAEVVNCYAASDVSGTRNVGGIVGHNACRMGNFGQIRNCYSVGQVTGSEDVGGVVGSNCGAVDSCFWNTETSGVSESTYGEGKTTREMQTATTFLEAGWDFIDETETENGTEDIWWILEGQDYPRLWWELGDEASP